MIDTDTGSACDSAARAGRRTTTVASRRRKRGAAGARSGSLANRFRIIGGRWRGRRIAFAPQPGLRPSPDRVRETLFNWLDRSLPGARCLDLFAGSGALGLEALSRGAASVTFVDRDAAALRGIETALELLGTDGGRCLRVDVRTFLSGAPSNYDVVFLDPPYAEAILPELCTLLDSRGWIGPDALVYLECAASDGAPVLPEGWTLAKSGRAGRVGYHLARCDQREPIPDSESPP